MAFYDAAGNELRVGDSVYIYFGYNSLRAGVVKDIQGKAAKVLVDAWPSHPDENQRYSLSKWKEGECMIKADQGTGHYPDEVILLIEEIRNLRDQAPANAQGLPIKQLCQHLLNYWDRKRPCNLVCS